MLGLAVGLDDFRDFFFSSLNDSMSVEIPSRLNSPVLSTGEDLKHLH